MQRSFPTTRLRRNRVSDFSRRLVRETTLSAADLIYPIFIIEGDNAREPVASMPGIDRLSIDLLVEEAHRAHAAGIPMIALFPNIDQNLRTPEGEQAWNPDGLVARAVRALKTALPELGVMTDAALDFVVFPTAQAC